MERSIAVRRKIWIIVYESQEMKKNDVSHQSHILHTENQFREKVRALIGARTMLLSPAVLAFRDEATNKVYNELQFDDVIALFNSKVNETS
jgi:hypothetical protein